jgi:oligopeptide transport system ATP-binding protein
LAEQKDVNVVDIENLKIHFPVRHGFLRKKVGDVKALDGVTFSIRPGETLGLVGESGCGKTTVGRAITQLYQPTEGMVKFKGKNLSGLSYNDLRPYKRQMAMVFQDPYSSLNPRQRAGDIVGEPLLVHEITKNNQEYRERVSELLRICGLNSDMWDRYPHEFSGGQRQRLAVARALAGNPSIIICDEPISALDVSMQAQILNLLQSIQEKNAGMSYLFISHDLLAVEYISQRVAVMYLGKIVELSSARDLYRNTLHPYSKALLSAQPLPNPAEEAKRQRIILEGDVPTPLDPPSGCSFHPRCPYAKPDCAESCPELKDYGNQHFVACHHVG